jgi:hypothetical protein
VDVRPVNPHASAGTERHAGRADDVDLVRRTGMGDAPQVGGRRPGDRDAGREAEGDRASEQLVVASSRASACES